jgi:hypothetical protein
MPLFRVRRMLRRWRQLTKRAGQSPHPGGPLAPAALLARYAQRSGLLDGSSAARRYPDFTSDVRGRRFQIYTRPRAGSREGSTFDIVFVRVVARPRHP